MRLTERWLLLAAERVSAQRAWLTDLDAAIGDGDHGINLDRGFQAIRAALRDDPAWAAAAADPPGRLLALAAGTIVGTVGGASGALYGRALARAAARLDAPRPTTSDLAVALAAAVDAIAALGRSAQGQKTMLDALVPARTAIAAAAAAGATLADASDSAARAAEAGSRTTIDLVATRGRASYLGDRSRGHLDPGAASAALLLRALADAAVEA